ncbi:hypothetical protein KRR38_12330 [Novosphingobium sp. G106]|uniref:hypothetical protein n=1 Tax=Novosphingobium sp. G106 TaxID=2849500 RepID=UPI001C2DCCA9|nr:hypothetical protein [Novosphingobium sp. G106]MBV1688440.1 hypothetical protein [Novosphingobium sp. G106]
MRFGWLMAAIAALWAMPAQAALDLKSGVFIGTIASGTASVIDFNTSPEVLDLAGLNVTFRINTTMDVQPQLGLVTVSFSIPDASNPFLQGFNTRGLTYDDLVTRGSDNNIHILGYVADWTVPSINSIFWARFTMTTLLRLAVT